MARQIGAFLRDRRGTTAIEYAVIGALLSIVIVAATTTMGVSLNTKFYSPIAGATR